MRDGLRLALTTFTVFPLSPGRADRPTARLAMIFAPLVGALLGLVLGGAALGLRELHSPVIGALLVALGAALTRGLHLDGLADTMDGLGAYAGRARTLAIMRSPEIGPFGVVAIGLVLLLQAGTLGALATRPAFALLAGMVCALGTGRLAVTWACRRGVPAARPDGLGALVAGTTGWPELVAGLVFVVAVAVAAVPDHPWQGPVAVLAGLGATLLLLRHILRRLGGITGDVLGALVEVGQTVVLVGLTFG